VSGAFSTATGSKGFGDYFGFVLAGFGLLAAIRFGRAVWRSFFGKRDRLNISRLSSDELSKARSKLLKNQKRGSL
jgi:hypothetical protein